MQTVFKSTGQLWDRFTALTVMVASTVAAQSYAVPLCVFVHLIVEHKGQYACEHLKVRYCMKTTMERFCSHFSKTEGVQMPIVLLYRPH